MNPRSPLRHLRESEYIQSALDLCERHTEKMTMDIVTLILRHATATRILESGVDAAAKAEILSAFNGEPLTGEKTNAFQLREDDANDWLERLREGTPVDSVLAAKLKAVFTGELGGFIKPSTFWTFKE